MKNTYRVVKITRLNGKICWAVQKQFNDWLTGKEVWKYFADYACDSTYSKNLGNAEFYSSEEDAVKQMNALIMYDNSTVVDIQVVKTASAK